MSDEEVQTVPDLAVGLVVKLARLREGVYASGLLVDSTKASPSRVVHLIPHDADLEGHDRVRAYCGADFWPGALEGIAWGDLWPHAKCVRESPVRRSALEIYFRTAENTVEQSIDGLGACFSAIEGIMGSREDWLNVKNSKEDWVYTASFNGVLIDERRFPRAVDLGFDLLQVELVRPHVLRIHSCGVRDGCPKHATHTETFSLDDVQVINDRLAIHEGRALSVDLQELSWCVVAGECAKTSPSFIQQ